MDFYTAVAIGVGIVGIGVLAFIAGQHYPDKNKWSRIENPDWKELARYNAEKARGVAHTEEWQAKMKERQVEFDAWADERYRKEEL